MEASTRMVIALIATVALGPLQAAEKPGAFASPDKKLDYLLETWNGRSLEELRTVWGRETSSNPRGQNLVYVFERTSRGRVGVSLFGGQVSASTSDIKCAALFEVDGESTIVRATRQGGGRECWNLFQRYTPRAD